MSFFYIFRIAFFEKASVGCLFRKEGTDALKDANENEKYDYTDVYDILMELVLTVTDRKAAETACADSACHCGETDKADSGDGGYADKLWNGFMKINAENETKCATAHTSCRFDLTGIYICESGFNLSCKEGNCSENKRYDSTCDTNRCSNDRSCKRN